MSKPKIIRREFKPTKKQLAEIQSRKENWQRDSGKMLGVKARADERPSQPAQRRALWHSLKAAQNEVEDLLNVLPETDEFRSVTAAYLRLLKEKADANGQVQ